MTDHFLVYNQGDKWQKTGLPSKPSLSIAIGHHSVTTDGAIVISAALSQEKQVDRAIDLLIAELNSIRLEAKRILADFPKPESESR